MTLLWINPATGNKFENKHLYVVDQPSTVETLARIGRGVFNERVRAFRGNREMKAKYGKAMRPEHANSLIVIPLGALKALELAIEANGFASGPYDMVSGVLFKHDRNGVQVGSQGILGLSVRPIPGTGNHEVWHLDPPTTVITKPLSVGEGALGQMSVQSFAPKVGDLATAMRALNHVKPTERGGIEVGRPIHLNPSASTLRLAAIRARELDMAEDT